MYSGFESMWHYWTALKVRWRSGSKAADACGRPSVAEKHIEAPIEQPSHDQMSASHDEVDAPRVEPVIDWTSEATTRSWLDKLKVSIVLWGTGIA